jgi:hypothetical protein
LLQDIQAAASGGDQGNLLKVETLKATLSSVQALKVKLDAQVRQGVRELEDAERQEIEKTLSSQYAEETDRRNAFDGNEKFLSTISIKK